MIFIKKPANVPQVLNSDKVTKLLENLEKSNEKKLI